jgi:hypothetical protein
MTARQPAEASALAALSQAERAALLGDLLAEHPELAGDAERLANRRLAGAGRHAVADDLSWSLESLVLEQLNLHAGYQRGRGYVHPVEAASELLEEALQPYLDDIARLAGLGLPAAAQEVAAGVLLGLYQYRDQPPQDTVMVEAPDFPAEAADQVMDALRAAGVDPPDGLSELLPDWSNLLRRE